MLVIVLPIFILILIIIYFILRLGSEELEFSGWKTIEEEPTKHFNKKGDSLHFVVYGKTGSGKTHFIKEYTSYDTTNTVVFCKDQNDWQGYEVLSEDNLNELDNMESFKDKTVILDDMAGYFKHNSIDDIFSKGRHFNIKLIVMGHKAADITNKGRGNINFFYCTTQNSDAFFDDIRDKYSTDDYIRNYKDIEYGMIRYDLIKNTYIVIDKHKNIIFDSDNPTINIKALKYKKTFSKEDKTMIGKYLMSRLVEPDEYDPSMFHDFLDNYLITNNVRAYPGTFDTFKTGTTKLKPYVDAIDATKSILFMLGSAFITIMCNYEKVQSFFEGKKKLRFDVEDEDEDNLEKTRIEINKELRRRRSVSNGRGRSVSRGRK